VMDFGDISNFMKPLVDQFLDHYFLNDTLVKPGFIPRATAEFIAVWIFGMIHENLCPWRETHEGPMVSAVRVYETRSSCAEATYEDYLEYQGDVVHVDQWNPAGGGSSNASHTTTRAHSDGRRPRSTATS